MPRLIHYKTKCSHCEIEHYGRRLGAPCPFCRRGVKIQDYRKKKMGKGYYYYLRTRRHDR